jgi:hypothetical protein
VVDDRSRGMTASKQPTSEDVADARVFAGIHFRTACEDGAAAGSEVAAHILENLMGRIHGEGE